MTWQSRGSALSKKGGIVVSIWKYGADLRLRHCSTTLGGAPADLLARYSRFAQTATPTARPSWSKDLIRRGNIGIYLLKIKCFCSKSKVAKDCVTKNHIRIKKIRSIWCIERIFLFVILQYF